jgi:hypothetical protein
MKEKTQTNNKKAENPAYMCHREGILIVEIQKSIT